MEKKTGWIITGVTAALCGCPGACILAFGAMMAMGGTAADLGVESIKTTGDPTTVGIVMLCLGLLMFAIPVAVGLYTRAKGIDPEAKPVVVDEDLPPAI